MTTTKDDLPEQLQKLQRSLENFWLAPLFPGATATRRGFKRDALAAGRKAVAIALAAQAAGDRVTARDAEKLARSLAPFAAGKNLGHLPA